MNTPDEVREIENRLADERYKSLRKEQHAIQSVPAVYIENADEPVQRIREIIDIRYDVQLANVFVWRLSRICELLLRKD